MARASFARFHSPKGAKKESNELLKAGMAYLLKRGATTAAVENPERAGDQIFGLYFQRAQILWVSTVFFSFISVAMWTEKVACVRLSEQKQQQASV